MTQIGMVKSVSEREVLVRVIRKSACGDHCSMCGACGGQWIDVSARCALEVAVGEKVCIQSSGGPVIGGMICLFILPVLLPILAYIFIAGVFGNVVGIVFAVVVLLLCGALILRLSKSKKYLHAVQAKVIYKVEE